MRHSFALWTLSLASVVLTAGCHMPLDSLQPLPCESNLNKPWVQPQTKVLPPAEMLAHPGPGVGGPGPGDLGGVQLASYSGGGGYGCGGGCGCGCGYGMGQPEASQIGFKGNDGMKIYWDVSSCGAFDSEPLVEPGRYNFPQGAIYRLKLTNVPGRAGVELYPTIELALATPRTEAFLAHNYIPFELTAEDFEQVLSGNFVTKVLYLPDAEHQDVVLAGGAETLVSTRLEPGKDPIIEAERRGSILAIIRLGNKDLQAPGGDMAGGGNGVMQASFHGALGHGSGVPCGACGMDGCGCGPGCGGGAAYGIPPSYVAGVTAPYYGMPMCGTPIGLPGPAHVPLGVPAGLETHTMTNWTHYSIPGPVHQVDVHVKQEPGLSYPTPVHKVVIVESTPTPPAVYQQPLVDRCQQAPGYDAGCGNCGNGNCGNGN